MASKSSAVSNPLKPPSLTLVGIRSIETGTRAFLAGALGGAISRAVEATSQAHLQTIPRHTLMRIGALATGVTLAIPVTMGTALLELHDHGTLRVDRWGLSTTRPEIDEFVVPMHILLLGAAHFFICPPIMARAYRLCIPPELAPRMRHQGWGFMAGYGIGAGAFWVSTKMKYQSWPW
ncbi:hypothetical protein MKEN_00979700 [Mycena kentingensis (nom. inval.)]|nr:hypothetical protein MKEN_00979700 [Mycena kentingensis (nom. inval.)]